jgi:hypothetical protein
VRNAPVFRVPAELHLPVAPQRPALITCLGLELADRQV